MQDTTVQRITMRASSVVPLPDNVATISRTSINITGTIIDYEPQGRTLRIRTTQYIAPGGVREFDVFGIIPHGQIYDTIIPRLITKSIVSITSFLNHTCDTGIYVDIACPPQLYKPPSISTVIQPSPSSGARSSPKKRWAKSELPDAPPAPSTRMKSK